MRLGPVFRLLGALVYGFIGYYLGLALVGTSQVNTWTAPTIWGSMFGGAILGYFLAPWIVIAPARAARNSLRNVPMVDLLAGTIGLSLGLLIALLLAFPISRLPSPFGTILPFVAVIIFGYLGAAVLVLRKDDLVMFLHAAQPAAKTPAASTLPNPHKLMDTTVIIDGPIAQVAETR